MERLTYQLNTSDNIKLHGIHWKLNQPKAVICLVHGLGEHAARYEHFAQWFAQKNYATIAYDRRGHGRSEGQKGHTPSYEAYLDEIDLLLNEAENQYPNIPKIIYGHSQGGNLVLNYSLSRKPQAKAIVATGPWIRLAFEPPKFLVMLGKFMKNVYPKFDNKNQLNTNHISRDKNVVKKYEDDPLVHDHISASTGIEMMKGAEKLDAFSGELPYPTLLMHGSEDQLTSPIATQEFANRISGDNLLKIWEGFYHEIHNEPEQNEVFEFTYNWLESKL